MAEWIGHFITNWPIWAVIIVLAVVSAVWIIYYFTSGLVELSFGKKEWWQDRRKRHEGQAKTGRVKMKAKKG